MTVETPHFGLEAFVLGDIYRGIVDQRRFTTIDMHMAFISDLIGEGKIMGWEISSPSSLVLKVSSGWGIINRYVTRTFGSYQKNLLDNTNVYVWMRLRPGVLGQVSAFSNVSSLQYTDNGIPLQPNGVTIDSVSTDSLRLTWNQSSEISFSKYQIYKSLDGSVYSLLAETTTSLYTDSNLKENTSYYYKILAINKTGTVGPFSSVVNTTTLKDLSKPADPTALVVVGSNKSIHLVWNSSAYGSVSQYKATITPVSVENLSEGFPVQVIVDSSEVNMTITGLLNDRKYLVLLKAVSKYGIESDGVSRYSIPRDNDGPIDVSSISVLDYASTSGISSNGLAITWSSSEDTYESIFDGASEIQLEEYRKDGTVVTSNWMPNFVGITTKSIEVFPYTSEGQSSYKSVEPRTVYYITVRNVDVQGNTSVGKRIKHYTKSFQAPNPIRSLSILDRSDKSLAVKWSNSSSFFVSNILTVKSIDLTSLTESVLIDKQDLGISTFFVLNSSYSQPNKRFVFTIYCVDEFGNNSSSVAASFDVASSNNLSRPPAPSEQVGFAGDKQNIISWNKPDTQSGNGFRVYRAEDQSSLEPEDFVLLETLSSDVYTFTDYEVTNNSTYVYFVTTVDIYGIESLNPILDSYLNYPLITLTPQVNSTLSPPSTLVVSKVSSSVQMTWQPTGGQFDGYEIYRSVNNKYSYSLIATVQSSVTSYLDSDVLDRTCSLYYIVRKFRNEADLFVTESDNAVSSALYLGKVSTLNGEVSVDTTGVRNLSLLEDPVREETKSRIALHTHSWISESDDRRINLGDKMVVEDWQTSDNQTYLTLTDISETTTFSVFINGVDISNSNILYSVDKIKGTITFEVVLASTGFDTVVGKTYPYATPPSISVRFNNLQETQGTLAKERIDGISGSQIVTGFVEKKQLPSINHDGKKRERLIPLQIKMSSIDDGYRYLPEVSSKNIGDGIVFYDVFQAKNDSDTLIASTSGGIQVSTDFGISWKLLFTPVTPVVRFFYSSKYDAYFAGTNRGILFSRNNTTGGFSSWNEVSGTENSKIIRGIADAPNGTTFCTSDLGVFKLQRDVGQGSFFFQQTPIFGPQSTEAYAVLYDSYRSRFIVSNELGIFETFNDGIRWTFSSEFSEQRPIFEFAQSNGTIFAITDYMLWRRRPQDWEFHRIGVFENATMARKLVVWKDRIYVSTDSGLIVSSSLNDIYSDATIVFENAFTQLRTKSFMLPATSLNTISDRLFVGSECKLFIAETHGNLSIHSEFSSTVIPTIYVNGEEQFIGYRYTTSTTAGAKFVCFDVKQKLGNAVTVANQYQNFQIQSGGWADTNFIASVKLFVDGQQINDMSLSERPAQAISQLQLPLYTDRNANKATADIAKTAVTNSLTALLKTTTDASGQVIGLPGFVKDNVITTLNTIEKFLSQLYSSARIQPRIAADGSTVTDESGNVVYDNFSIPQFRVILLSSPARSLKTGFQNFGVYSSWAKSSANSQFSVIGNYGSELTSDGKIPNTLIGGSGDKGLTGG